MGQLCSCHSGKAANRRQDFSTSWSNLLSRGSSWSSWRRRRLKSVEFLGHDNLPLDPIPTKAFQLIDRCEKHLSFVSRRSRSAPEQNAVNGPEPNGASDAERSESEQNSASDVERSGVSDAERNPVSEADDGIERVLCRESVWRNTVEEARRRRALLQWQRSKGGAKSLNLPDTGYTQTVQPPLARFLRKKPPGVQSTEDGSSDPWSCGRLVEGATEWLCDQLDPWALFQSFQGLNRRVDWGHLALELGRCTTRTDSCRCLLDYATAVPPLDSDRMTSNFGLVREVLSASKDDRLVQVARFLEVVDAIVDLSRSIGRGGPHQSTIVVDEDRPTSNDPEEPGTSGEPLLGPPKENSLPEMPTADVIRRKDGCFRSEIIAHPSKARRCLYTTTGGCTSVDGGPTAVRRDLSFTRRRHSALCHSDDEPRNLWPAPNSLEAPEVIPSLSISVCGIDLDDNCARELTRILVEYPYVTHLSVVRSGLGDGTHFGELCRAFDRGSSSSSASCSASSTQTGGGGIEHFDFRMNPLSPGDCIDHLSGALSRAASLRSVNLSSTGLGAEACRCLLDAIGTGSAANRVLEELDLGYNELDDEGCSSVASLIELPGCWLRRLRLRHNGIGPVGARRLATALLTHPRLTLLDVSSNPIGDAGVASLAESLLGNRTLRDLALDDCGMTGEGCRGVARMLMTNSVLRSLTLSRNSLGDEGVRTLAEGIRYNRTLEVLAVDMCCLGNAGFIRLLQELHWCHSLRVVRACYNSIGIPDQLQSSASGYRRWSSASVRLDPSTVLGPSGAEPQLLDVYVQLCDVLRQNPKLKIFLWGNRLDEEDDDVTSASAFRPEAGDPGAKWRRSRSALDSGYGTLS